MPSSPTGRRVKLFYATQTDVAPPTVVLFVNEASWVNEAYQRDPAVHRVMTPGAWREIRWAQRSVVADGSRIECPLLFLLAGEDRVVDAQLARAFADGLKAPVQVRWYPEMYHEVLNDPQRDRVMEDIVAFLSQHGLA